MRSGVWGLGCKRPSTQKGSRPPREILAPAAPPALFRISGFVFRVSGFVFRVSGFVFRVSGFVFRVSCFGFRFPVFSFQFSGGGSRVSGNSTETESIQKIESGAKIFFFKNACYGGVL